MEDPTMFLTDLTWRLMPYYREREMGESFQRDEREFSERERERWEGVLREREGDGREFSK